MGKGSKPIIGYHYHPAWHHGLAAVEIDAFLEFRGGDRTAWQGRLTASGTISVNAPNLFGGEKDQGGAVGDMDVLFGEPTQMPNSYLISTFGEKTPAWRGFTTVVWKGGRYGAMNPYPKPASYKVERILKGWDGGEAWYAEKARIGLIPPNAMALYFALDISGSMGEITSNGETRLANMQTAVNATLDLINDLVIANGAAVDIMVVGWGTEPNIRTSILRRVADAADIEAIKAWVSALVSTGGYYTYFPAGLVDMNTFFSGAPSGSRKFTFFLTDGLPTTSDDSMTEGEIAEAAAALVAAESGVAVHAMNIDLENTTYTSMVDNTSADGVPVVSGGDPGAMTSIIVAALGGLWGCNPAHVLYESRTCLDMGREPIANINQASLQAAADKLYAQGFGVCTKWDPASESVEDLENRICRLIGGSFTRSIEDGQWYLDLAGGDYVLADLPILTDDDILSFEEQPSTLDSAVNSVSVRYFDPVRKEHIVTPPVRALGLVAAFGTIHKTYDFPEIPTSGLALRVALRLLQDTAAPTRVFDLSTTRHTWSWRPNTYFRLQTPKRGIADMVCVVGEKDSGSLRSGAIKMKVTQEPASLPDASFVEVEPGVDTTPDQTPTAITLQRAEEAPYIEVVSALSRADLAALPDDAGFAMAIAATASSDLDFTMMVASDGGSYAAAGHGQWCATALVVEAAPLEGALETEFTLSDGQRLEQVEVGMAALWGSELCRVDVAPDNGAITLGRACGDTVPAEHAAGERIWFYQVGFAYDPTEYTDGEAIDVKLLSNTGSQQLPESAATPMDLTFDQRQARPYPPGAVTLNGDYFPAAIEGTEVTVAWAHRDRVLQADQLLEFGASSVGPEAGTTYNVRYFLNGIEVDSETGIAGTSATLFDFGSTGTGRVELESQRDGLVSWQMFSHEFTMNAPAQFVALPLTYDEEDAAGTMTWVRQGNGPHVTPMGFEGDGYEARLKSTTIPAWMTSASAVLTMHASISFYPQELKSTSEFAVYAGIDSATPESKLILCAIDDATNPLIPQLALRGNTSSSTFVEKKLCRSNWKFQFRMPDLTAGGFDARPQCVAFIDADTVLVSAHFEDTLSRFYKIRLSDAAVLGQFDCGATYKHLTCCAFRSNGDFWAVDSGTFKTLRIDLDASFSSGTMVILDVCDTSGLHQVGAIEFVTVSGTEYMLLCEYDTTGTVYLYVFAASLMGTVTLTATDRYKRFPCGYEVQGHAMRSGKLFVSALSKKGESNRYGFVQRFDITTAITSTADGGAISAEATWDAPSKYVEDVAVHPSTNDLWMPTEGISSVGSDDGGLSVWSSPLDGSLVENHYTCEYDGSGTTTIKVNGRLYDTMAGTLSPTVAAVCIGGPPSVAAGISARYFTGFVRNVVFQDQPMTAAQYNAAVNGDHEPNSLTAYNFSLTNPGGESGSSAGWTNESGGLGVLNYPGGSATVPHGGSYFFSGGTSATTVARQRLDVLAQTGLTGPDVDAGGIWAKVRWWQASLDSAADSGAMGLRTLNSTPTSTGEAYAGLAITPNSAGTYRPWYPRAFAANLPSGTRHIDALIKAVRSAGTNNDAWTDDVTVTVYRQ